MALATRPKPNVHHKKRRAQHHRHSKTYVKAYWPYLPMLIIVGAGASIDKLWSSGALVVTGSQTLSPQLAAMQPLTRVQFLTNDQTGSILAGVIILSGLAFAIFIFRHSYRLHRAIHAGEAFVTNHAWLDIATVFVFTAGFILTRPNGILG
jgi:hypothetical protein